MDAIFLAPTARPIHPCRIGAERRGGFFRASHSRPSVPHICQRVEEENTLLFLSLFYFRLPTSPLPLSHGRHLARRGKNKAKKRSEGSEGGGETKAVSSLSLSSPRARWIQSSEPSSSSCRKTQMGEITLFSSFSWLTIPHSFLSFFLLLLPLSRDFPAIIHDCSLLLARPKPTSFRNSFAHFSPLPVLFRLFFVSAKVVKTIAARGSKEEPKSKFANG